MKGKNLKLPRELIAPSAEMREASERIGLHWWYWDTREHRLTVSPGLLRILGYTPAEYDPYEPTIYRNIHPEDAGENKIRFGRLLEGEIELYEIEYRVKNREGAWEWYYNRGNVIEYRPDGKPAVVGGISMNISGRFSYLLSMLEEKQKFEFIFRHSNEAIMIIELRDEKAFRVVDANEAAVALFETDKSRLVGEIPPAFATDALIGVSGSGIRRLRETGFVRFEKEVVLGEEKRAWLEFTGHSFNLTGEDLVLAIVKDITSGKLTEAALRESEKLYRILFEAANDRVALLTTEGKFLLVNTAFYHSVGYTREEFLEIDRRDIIHPDDFEMVIKKNRELPEKDVITFEYRVRHREGHYLHMSAKNVLIPGEEDGKEMILSISRDVTADRKLIEKLEVARQRAEESDRLKSAFLANMSHEIRTPMNSIVGFSHLLVDSDLDDSQREEYAHRIIRNSEILLTLISDIIDLARIESGQLEIIYDRMDLSELLEELHQYALDEIKRMKKRDLEILVEKEIKSFQIEADMIRISQVMKNLVNNAIKFTPAGTVKIGFRRKGDKKVVLFVEDTGIGIDPVSHGMIFEQFRQIDDSNTRKFGGTGLGLSISKNLVQLMGGRIGIRSELGKGALFQVELPVRRPLKPGQLSRHL